MKHKLFFLAFILLCSKIYAQKGNLEIMTGDAYLHYQHSFTGEIKPGSIVGWQHIATLIKQYETNPEKGGLPDEVMNQFYVTLKASKAISLKGGLFYTNATGFKPSAAVQFLFGKNNWVMVISPRIDIMKNPSYELFLVTSYTKPVNDLWKLYFRLQAMTSVARFHNRSYQLARVGVSYKGLQFGAGLNFDEYGRNKKVYNNLGIFIQAAL
jgi:hypothetical protein